MSYAARNVCIYIYIQCAFVVYIPVASNMQNIRGYPQNTNVLTSQCYEGEGRCDAEQCVQRGPLDGLGALDGVGQKHKWSDDDEGHDGAAQDLGVHFSFIVRIVLVKDHVGGPPEHLQGYKCNNGFGTGVHRDSADKVRLEGSCHFEVRGCLVDA